jgi:hypothetical protein
MDLYGPEICKLCLNHADSVRQDEIDASLIIAQTLESVESVGWSSFFGKKSKTHSKRKLNQLDLGRKTRVWIIRTGGKDVETSMRRVVVV